MITNAARGSLPNSSNFKFHKTFMYFYESRKGYPRGYQQKYSPVVIRNFFSFILGVKVSLELHETSGSKWNLYRIFILMWLFICIMCPYTEHKFGLIHRIPFGNETLKTSYGIQ